MGRNRPAGTGQCVAGKKDGMKQGAIGGILKELVVNFEHTSETMFIPYRGEKFEYIGGKSYRFMARLA